MKLSIINSGYNAYLVPGIKNDTTTFYYMVKKPFLGEEYYDMILKMK